MSFKNQETLIKAEKEGAKVKIKKNISVFKKTN